MQTEHAPRPPSRPTGRGLHTLTAGRLGARWVVTVGNIAAQMAGSTTPGMSGEELKTIARGWRATTPILGTPVANDKRETVGEVDDLIIAPDRAISSAIMGVGGGLGLGERQGAVPVNRFKHTDGRIVRPGATEDALQAMPSPLA